TLIVSRPVAHVMLRAVKFGHAVLKSYLPHDDLSALSVLMQVVWPVEPSPRASSWNYTTGPQPASSSLVKTHDAHAALRPLSAVSSCWNVSPVFFASFSMNVMSSFVHFALVGFGALYGDSPGNASGHAALAT